MQSVLILSFEELFAILRIGLDGPGTFFPIRRADFAIGLKIL